MLEHGKHVLCEKPIGLTADQAEEMADFAKEMVNAHLTVLGFRVGEPPQMASRSPAGAFSK